MPQKLAFLLTIGLAEFNLSLQRASGKYSLASLYMKAVAQDSLQLWEGLVLRGLSLEFDYNKGSSKAAKILASLAFGNEDHLNIILAYNGRSISSSEVQKLPSSQTVTRSSTNSTIQSVTDDRSDDSASWSAEVSYAGKISVLDGVKNFAKIDDISDATLRDLLSTLFEVVNFEMTEPKIVLAHGRRGTSFTFSSGMSNSIFKHVEVYCSKKTSWFYYIRLDFENANIFEKLNLDIPIALVNPAVTFSNYDHTTILPSYDPTFTFAKADSTVALNNKISNVSKRGLRASLDVTLVFSNDLSDLEGFVKKDKILIHGELSKTEISIWAQTDRFNLLDNGKERIALAGAVGLGFNFEKKKLQVGLKGNRRET